MADAQAQAASTRIDIGLSKEDQARIDALRQVNVGPKKAKSVKDWYVTLNAKLQSFSAIKLEDKVTFFELLSVMINAGMPLIRSLYVLSDQIDNQRLGAVARDLALRMEKGSTLSDGMKAYPKVFGESEVGMVASGEVSGNLKDILKDIAAQIAKTNSIAGKVKGAMVYPAAIIVIMIVALFLMLTLVVPQITEVFAEGGKELPVTTQILIAMSDYARSSWLTLLLLVAAAMGGGYIAAQTSSGKKAIHMGILYIPVFGVLIRKVLVARFARLLSSLLKAGIPIVKTLEITANALGNEVYKKRVIYASQDVAQGIPLGENLSDSQFLFPPMVASMILVGEQTANITEVASKVADYYEEEVDTAVASLSKLMEPVILVVMGSVVGFLVSAIMQPIIALSDVSSVI